MKYSFPSLKTASGENHNFTDPEMRPTRYFALTIGFLCATVTLIFGNACISWGAEKKIFIKVPKVYTVREGDNLWDLSGKNYQDNFKWRKVWGRNSYIVDPNLIFPGDQIILPGKFVEKEVSQISLQSGKKSEKKEKKRIQPFPLPPPDPGPLKIISDAQFLQAGYIAVSEKWAGKIVSGPEERSIYGKGDTIFLKMKSDSVSPGRVYSIVEKLETVVHPVSKDVVGNVVQEVGLVEITDTRVGSVTGLVQTSFSAIEKGDLLVTYKRLANPYRDLLLRRKSTGVDGVILTGREFRGVFGKGSIVYIDKGREDGVQDGDRFEVYKGGKAVGGSNSGAGKVVLPDSVFGKVEVFNARSNTSTAIVISFVKEFYPGAFLRSVAY